MPDWRSTALGGPALLLRALRFFLVLYPDQEQICECISPSSLPSDPNFSKKLRVAFRLRGAEASDGAALAPPSAVVHAQILTYKNGRRR
eukprot:COSAG06_NODE_504_length_14946_cov_34.563750_5_plen_89_part_00